VSVFDRLVTVSLPVIPRFVAGVVSRPYIAGESLADAVAVVRSLNRLGAKGTMDLLGEELTEPEPCREVGRSYVAMLHEIAAAGIDSGVSVKLSSLGLRLDPDLARELLRGILAAARDAERFVRIDMEDATATDRTLALYREMREAGFDNVGVVLQARLHRTCRDARDLAEMGADVRVVKGIYVEPDSIAWREPEIIRRNYVRILRLLMAKGCRVASATHDEILVYETQAAAEELGTPPDRLEYQMLLGVREGLRDTLIRCGRRLRVYVPFGEQWYPYSIRRLRENPAIAGHVTRAFLRKLFRRKRKKEQPQ
jgi:proline dehydrogenase